MSTHEKSDSRVAVVTGGARGIGLAVAQRFLGEGYRVALLDIDRRTLRATERRLRDPGRLLAIVCDVSDAKQVNAAIRQIAKNFGRIDALVNNAGIAIFKPVLETSLAEWQRVLAVNLGGAFICTHACAPVMLKTAAARS